MIITCNNCHKKFEVDPSLIYDEGRLLQCNSCDHKWFFKKETANEFIPLVETRVKVGETNLIDDKFKLANRDSLENINLLDNDLKVDSVLEKNLKDKDDDNDLDVEAYPVKSSDKKDYNILGLIIVFIISFIALIIILDTFQRPISKIIPNIEFFLYSLYETITDIRLFLRDLI
ncbi:zinc-ribbon domain-containing protein [Candidatus Pelagibacter sp.]|nr:zinc-ribbon domain-containing protein [Candidatus Pelagibacter sp.]